MGICQGGTSQPGERGAFRSVDMAMAKCKSHMSKSPAGGKGENRAEGGHETKADNRREATPGPSPFGPPGTMPGGGSHPMMRRGVK